MENNCIKPRIQEIKNLYIECKELKTEEGKMRQNTKHNCVSIGHVTEVYKLSNRTEPLWQ